MEIKYKFDDIRKNYLPLCVYARSSTPDFNDINLEKWSSIADVCKHRLLSTAEQLPHYTLFNLTKNINLVNQKKTVSGRFFNQHNLQLPYTRKV